MSRARLRPTHRRPRARGAPGSAPRRSPVPHVRRRARDEVPGQRQPGHVGRARVTCDRSGRDVGGAASHHAPDGASRVRQIALGTLAALLVLTTTASAEDTRVEAARKEGKVVWYTSLALPSAEKVAKLFEAAYPGNTVGGHRSGSPAL